MISVKSVAVVHYVKVHSNHSNASHYLMLMRKNVCIKKFISCFDY